LPYSANAYVVDYKNPHAITDVINHVENGQYGSVTKDIDALITRKMQILGPYFAQHPSLINKYLKGVTDHEETHPLENIKVTGMSHQNVKNFDFDRRHIQKDVAAPKREKNVPAAPIPVFHQFVSLKPIFHRVLLPKRETPAIKMIVSFALRFFMEHIIFKHIESCVFFMHILAMIYRKMTIFVVVVAVFLTFFPILCATIIYRAIKMLLIMLTLEKVQV
jgi:hypothetical protein